MARILYGPQQRTHTLTTLKAIVRRFERDDQLLASRHGHQPHDGYPTSSGLAGTRQGGTADPTGRAATIRIDHPAGDAIGDHVAKAWQLVHQAARLLEQADSHRARALPPEATGHTDADWCSSCLRAHVISPVYRAGRCRWCWEYQRSEHQNPPVALVTKHARGGRITQADVAQARHSAR